MEKSVQITIKASTLADLQKVAADRMVEPEELADAALRQGLDAMRQRMFFEARMNRARNADVSRALEILNKGGNEPPIPGDELPEGYIPVDNRRRA